MNPPCTFCGNPSSYTLHQAIGERYSGDSEPAETVHLCASCFASRSKKPDRSFIISKVTRISNPRVQIRRACP